MDHSSTATTPAATSPLSKRIKALLENYNQEVAKDDAEYQREYPGTPASHVYTLGDMVKALSASDIRGGFGLNALGAMELIVDEIMREIAGGEYDPWPELTKGDLRFLIGDRRNSPQCPYDLYAAAWCDDEDKPLTFAERVLADRHRAWLEKGSETRRKRLAKAQAEVARLTGKAA